MKEKVLEEIKKIIASEFEDIEKSSTMTDKVEEQLETLTSTLDELSNKVEALSSEKEQLEASLKELEELKKNQVESITELEGKVEESNNKLEEVLSEKASLQEKLDAIEKDRIGKERIDALVNEGLLLDNEEAAARQKEKVLGFSTEEFEAYKEELKFYKEAFAAKGTIIHESQETASFDTNGPTDAAAVSNDGEDKLRLAAQALSKLLKTE